MANIFSARKKRLQKALKAAQDQRPKPQPAKRLEKPKETSSDSFKQMMRELRKKNPYQGSKSLRD